MAERRRGRSLDWQGPEGDLGSKAAKNNAEHLTTYKGSPTRVREDVSKEGEIYQGGYAGRQVYELVQNAADAARLAGIEGRIEFVFSEDGSLYCANTGEPLTTEGLTALQFNHLSPKIDQDVDLIGRYGVGFKSLLAVTKRAAIFSRSGSVEFDGNRARREIRSVCPGAEETPAMRFAFPLDPSREFESDDVLAELAKWADTIVRLPVQRDSRSLVRRELDEFPAEFLLFARHAGKIKVNNLGNTRTLSASERDGIVSISDSGQRRRWRVLDSLEDLSDEAKQDAPTGYRDGTKVPVLWAAPVGEPIRGQIWAFFPTEVECSLSGILNAPWKTPVDRTSVSSGVYNTELLNRAGRLVAESLEHVVDDLDEPGAVVDLLPEEDPDLRIGWLESELAEATYEACSGSTAFSDSEGVLQVADALKLSTLEPHPKTGELWAQAPEVPSGWAHWTFFTPKRRDRLEILGASVVYPWMTNAPGRRTQVDGWVESLVSGLEPASSLHATRVIADHELRDTNGRRSRKIPRETSWRSFRVVLARDGEALHAPTSDRLRMDTPPSETFDAITVHPTVSSDPDVAAYLTAVGVESGIDDAAAALELATTLVAEEPPRSDDGRFAQLWDHINAAGLKGLVDDLSEIVGEKIWVRCLDGNFRLTCDVLWPGVIAPPDGSGGPAATVDADFHADHHAILKRVFSVTDSPSLELRRDALVDASWEDDYEQDGVNRFVRHLQRTSRRPQIQSLRARYPRRVVWPLGVAEHLSDEGSARFSAAVIDVNPRPANGDVAHRNGRYDPLAREGPEVWVLNQYGQINTTLGVRSLRDGAHIEGLHPDLLSLIPVVDLGTLENVDEPGETADLYGLRTTPDTEDLKRAAEAQVSDDLMERLLQQVLLTELGSIFNTSPDWPFEGAVARSAGADGWVYCDDFRCVCGKYRNIRFRGIICERCGAEIFYRVDPSHNDIEKLSVTAFPELFPLEIFGPYLALRSTDLRDWVEGTKAMPSLDENVKVEVCAEGQADPVPLSELLPGVEVPAKWLLSAPQGVVCTELGLELTYEVLDISAYRPLRVLRQENIWYLQAGDDDVGELAKEVSEELWRAYGVLVDPTELEPGLMGAWQSAELKQRMEDAASRSTDEEKLVVLIGRENVREVMATVCEAIGASEDLDDFDLGRVLISRFGVAALKANAKFLPRGAPQRWTGNPKARRFVADVGLSSQYAGSTAEERPQIEEVDGPTDLGVLHDYQETIADRIKELVDNSERGLVALPTGAGKTRVAVEGLIRAATEVDLWPVLWVAQSDELCEQAAESWRSVWRAVGEKDSRLTITRLWGKNELRPVEGAHVVVASIQKLRSIDDRPDGSFDLRPGAVVFDEAHRSIAPSYTQILRSLEEEDGNSDFPLLGLTATPFRGVNESETQWLVNRYGRNRLDLDLLGDDPLTLLRERGVLAEADHEVLATGYELTLDPAGLEHFRTFETLPAREEERLGLNQERTRRIVDRILELPDDWPILLYCPSVSGADLAAAMLALEGIATQSLSAETPVDARRQAVRDFKAGVVRVLTNYRILTEGFDAPGARAVVISRPVFSRNLYQQIVGRGLRGPLNGGKEKCLIVDVEDNYLQFGGQLAFQHFDYLWE